LTADRPAPTAAPVLEHVFRPRAVAVVGASPRVRLTGTLIDNLTSAGAEGPAVHLVNPRYERIGERPCHASVPEIGAAVDLALVMVPARGVPAVLRDCAAAGVPVAVVLSSGFAETRREEGVRLQREVDEVVAETGLRVIGPNCQGAMYSPAGLYGAFSQSVTALAAANSGRREDGSGLAYVGQSGALGGSFLSLSAARHTPLTAWLSVGNQCDVTVAEAVQGLVADDRVRVIAAYLERIPDGRTWRRAVSAAAGAGKRVVVLRAGRSEAGKAAAAAHTGSMIGGSGAFDAVNRAAGVVAVDDFGELVERAVALTARQTVPGPRIGVVTTSGGAGILAADWIERNGLQTARLSDETVDQLSELIPDFGHAHNPVDVTAEVLGNREQFGRTCRVVADDPGVDLTLVVVTGISGANAADLAGRMTAELAGRPAAVAWLYASEETGEARAVLAQAGIPVFDSPSAATSWAAAAAAVRGGVVQDSGTAPASGPERGVVQESWTDAAVAAVLRAAGPEGAIGEADAPDVLDALGIATPRTVVITRPEDAARAVAEVGGTAVLKGQAPGLTHKSDIGAVALDVRPADAEGEFKRIAERIAAWDADAARESAVLAQTQVAGGLELLVSVQRAEDGYPPLVSVALGGTRTEIWRDIRTAACPLDAGGARRLLDGLRFRRLLYGFRDEPPVDVDAVAEALVRVSRLAVGLDGRLDLEINPLIVHPEGKGATAVDLVAALDRSDRSDRSDQRDQPDQRGGES
jgi:acyl-CoA synthetase (NDP forming)